MAAAQPSVRRGAVPDEFSCAALRREP